MADTDSHSIRGILATVGITRLVDRLGPNATESSISQKVKVTKQSGFLSLDRSAHFI